MLHGLSGVVLTRGAWYMCQNRMGHGATPETALLNAGMVLAMYSVGAAILTSLLPRGLRLVCAVVALLISLGWVAGVMSSP